LVNTPPPRDGEEHPIGAELPSTERELIVLAMPEADLRATGEGIESSGEVDIAPLADLLASENANLRPLFGVNEERLKARTTSLLATTDADVADLSVYYRVDAPEESLHGLAEQLRELDVVEAAYVKPPGEPPLWLNNMVPLAEEPPIHTPDFCERQGYLNAAPIGIDARYAWTIAGGRGAEVRIVDLEWSWRFSHEDLTQNQGGVVGGVADEDDDHGTAVIGELGGDRNTFGIEGICSDANVSAVAFSMPSAAAIRLAADRLRPGDIILLEIHRPGPSYDYEKRYDQQGYIAIEWWPDDFDAIRYAIARGIVVVEAAGNGAENLDAPIYSTRPANFPADWTNPFDRANRDSGAIVVGAGNPPAGTHGRNADPATGEVYVDRARCGFSNYGNLIDAQGWGFEVTSTGYGDLQGGANRDEWYIDEFSGTSSASPIIVGALGCVQGILRAHGRYPLTSARARQLLRTTGSPQQGASGRPTTQHIGNRPDLRQLIDIVMSDSVP